MDTHDRAQQLAHLLKISKIIARFVFDKDRQYGSSWRRRGGVGAFFIIARKWDRIEQACASEVFGQQDGEEVEKPKWDLFERFARDKRQEGIKDDVVDLIGYLLVLLEHMIATGHVTKICDTDFSPEPQTVIHEAPGGIGMRHPHGFDPEYDVDPGYEFEHETEPEPDPEAPQSEIRS